MQLRTNDFWGKIKLISKFEFLTKCNHFLKYFFNLQLTWLYHWMHFYYLCFFFIWISLHLDILNDFYYRAIQMHLCTTKYTEINFRNSSQMQTSRFVFQSCLRERTVFLIRFFVLSFYTDLSTLLHDLYCNYNCYMHFRRHIAFLVQLCLCFSRQQSKEETSNRSRLGSIEDVVFTSMHWISVFANWGLLSVTTACATCNWYIWKLSYNWYIVECDTNSVD